MTERKQIRYSIFSFKRYIFFFILLSFIITCAILLFVNGLNLELKGNEWNAITTFINVFVLSLLFTVLEGIYYKFTLEKPLSLILDATEKITKGNFDIQIKSNSRLYRRNEMDIIIENINKMSEELSSIETLRSDFIANVSHELKTPVSIIKNYADLLQNTNITKEESEEYAKVISNTSRNLSDLIMNILRLSKLENQKILLNKETYNLSEQLTSCLLQFEQIWEDKKIDLKVNIEEQLNINADKELMSIVWNNLLSNAFKFTDAHGRIGVMAKKTEDGISVSIQDTGCGMNKEVGKHIFDKFYQGDISHATKGNGLGLALVKKIMELTKYDINVESELRKGTKFTVNIYEK